MGDLLEFISYLGGLIVGLVFLIVLIGVTCFLIVAVVYKALFGRFLKQELTPEEQWRKAYYDEIV